MLFGMQTSEERAGFMKVFVSIIGLVILLCMTGCADTAVSNSQNEADVPLWDESEHLTSGETVSESAEGSQVPSALIPAVMIDGVTYYLSQGYPIPDEEITLDQVDYTESEVSLGKFPEKDKESNYAPAGTPYVKYGKGYALKMEESGWT